MKVYEIQDTTLRDRFPELERPLCAREGKYGWFTCGHCRDARAVAHGMKYAFVRQGEKTYKTKEQTIAYLIEKCRSYRTEETDSVTVVKEIRREGQRILKPGANVYVQLKRKKGTRKDTGYIVECYANNTVKIRVAAIGNTVIVPADEFVTGRNGTTNIQRKRVVAMAEKLDQWPSNRVRRGAYSRYPWETWLDGNIWKLTKDEDFFADMRSMRIMVYKQARDRNARCNTTILDENTMVIQAITKEDNV